MSIEKESPEELGYDNIQYNLAESSVTDFVLKDLELRIQDLSLCYTDHKGKPALRELIVSGYNNLDKENVLLTVGAASALFIIASSLLSKEDHLIVVRPNYATNIKTPETIGCDITFIDLLFENNWQLDINDINKAIRPNTKYISITHPHNPTGTLVSEADLSSLIKIAEHHNLYLLADETYRELCFTEPYPLAASLSQRAISVSSISKAYGLPGLRIGWLITRDEQLMDLFLAAKEQIFITNSVLDEEVTYQFFSEKENYFKTISKQIARNFSIVEKWMAREKRLEWVKPGGGVVCFPRMKAEYKFDTNRFYDTLLHKYKTLVGPGHWFDMPDNYLRIGYAWPSTVELEKGLENISLALDESIK
ncbi:MAG: transaminase protein [Chitinophagaceae bacterium]|nr:transaminase protein [Chitinophagaceae bacterium]